MKYGERKSGRPGRRNRTSGEPAFSDILVSSLLHEEIFLTISFKFNFLHTL